MASTGRGFGRHACVLQILPRWIPGAAAMSAPDFGEEKRPAQCDAVTVDDKLVGLAERLDRLLLTANDNGKFILSTKSAKNIVEIVRVWLKRAPANRESGPAGEPQTLAMRNALLDLIRTATLLQQNSVGCAELHHSLDTHLNGLPGWLTDTKASIDRASAVLTGASPTPGEQK
jgi:hypothetical protein